MSGRPPDSYYQANSQPLTDHSRGRPQPVNPNVGYDRYESPVGYEDIPVQYQNMGRNRSDGSVIDLDYRNQYADDRKNSAQRYYDKMTNPNRRSSSYSPENLVNPSKTVKFQFGSQPGEADPMYYNASFDPSQVEAGYDFNPTTLWRTNPQTGERERAVNVDWSTWLQQNPDMKGVYDLISNGKGGYTVVASEKFKNSSYPGYPRFPSENPEAIDAALSPENQQLTSQAYGYEQMSDMAVTTYGPEQARALGYNSRVSKFLNGPTLNDYLTVGGPNVRS